MSDAERFKDAAPFIVRCRGCQGELSFAPVHDSVCYFSFDFMPVNQLTGLYSPAYFVTKVQFARHARSRLRWVLFLFS